MRTVEVTVQFLDPRTPPTKEECQAFIDGDCKACGAKESVALQTSDEFTNFYFCHECDLHIHREVLMMFVDEYVPGTGDAVMGMIKALTEKGETP